MKNLKKDDLIFPTLLRQVGQDAYRLPYPNETSNPIQNHITSSYGLTKRELFAAMAMQGYITDPNSSPNRAAVFAVKCADALLAELNKGKEATDE